MTPKSINALGAAIAAAMAWTAAAAAECPRKDALGTSRVLAVDAATSPRVGLVLKADIRPGHTGQLAAKVARIEDRLAGA